MNQSHQEKQLLQELRKSFFQAFTQEEWEVAVGLQIQIVQIYLENETAKPEEVAREMHNLAVVLDEIEEFAKAEDWYERAANAKRMCGGATMSLADTLNNLGIVYHKLQKHKKGVEAHEEVLAIHNRYLAKDSRERMQTLWHLGNGYEFCGSYEKAISSLEEVLQWAGREKEYTKIELAQIYGELAFSYQKICNYKKGIHAYESGLYWLEKESQQETYTYLQYMWGLSDLYDAAGYGIRAVEYGEKALLLEEKNFQKDTMHRVKVMEHFGLLCRENGAYDTSIKWYHMALEILEEEFGNMHLDYRKIQMYLAMSYFVQGIHQGNIDKSKKLQMAVDILNDVLAKNQGNEDCIEVLAAFAFLTKIEHERGNHVEDMKYLEQIALDLFWRIDIKAKNAIEVVFFVAKLLYETKIYEGAWYCVDLILHNSKKSHKLYLKALYLMGDIWQKQGWQEAQIIFAQKAKAAAEEVHPLNHIEVIKSWKYLGNAYKEAEDFMQAQKYFKKAFDAESVVLGEESPHYKDTLMQLAEVFFWKGKYQECISYLKQNNDLFFEKTEEEIMGASLVLLCIATAYLAMGNEETADAYYKESKRKISDTSLQKTLQYEKKEVLYQKLRTGQFIQYMGEETEPTSVETFDEAKEICKNLESMLHAMKSIGECNLQRDAFMANCIAGVYYKDGAYREALQWYQKAEKWGEENQYLFACIAVGRMYLRLCEGEKALRQFVNAKEYVLEYRNADSVLSCMISGWIGDCYVDMGEEYLALQTYIGWERKNKDLHMPKGKTYESRVLYTANILEKVENINLAINWYEKYIVAVGEQLSKRESYARAQLKITKLLLEENMQSSCVERLDEVFAFGKDKKGQKHTYISSDVFVQLEQLYLQLGEEEKAKEALNLADENNQKEGKSLS